MLASICARTSRDPLLTLPAAQHVRLLDRAVERDLSGGRIYDALIAATVRHAGATLVTLDLRAAETYMATEADYRLLPG